MCVRKCEFEVEQCIVEKCRIQREWLDKCYEKRAEKVNSAGVEIGVPVDSEEEENWDEDIDGSINKPVKIEIPFFSPFR